MLVLQSWVWKSNNELKAQHPLLRPNYKPHPNQEFPATFSPCFLDSFLSSLSVEKFSLVMSHADLLKPWFLMPILIYLVPSLAQPKDKRGRLDSETKYGKEHVHVYLAAICHPAKASYLTILLGLYKALSTSPSLV